MQVNFPLMFVKEAQDKTPLFALKNTNESTINKGNGELGERKTVVLLPIF